MDFNIILQNKSSRLFGEITDSSTEQEIDKLSLEYIYKVMTNLDSILQSRDVTLSTKVCLVKAMVFLVVMMDVSWTIKKAERQRIDAF